MLKYILGLALFGVAQGVELEHFNEIANVGTELAEVSADA